MRPSTSGTTTLNASNHLVCVQNVYIDANNNLWILDPTMLRFTGPVPGGPKLIQIDLELRQGSEGLSLQPQHLPG